MLSDLNSIRNLRILSLNVVAMPYRFFIDSTVEANIQHILHEQLEKAIQELSEGIRETPEQAFTVRASG